MLFSITNFSTKIQCVNVFKCNLTAETFNQKTKNFAGFSLQNMRIAKENLNAFNIEIKIFIHD